MTTPVAPDAVLRPRLTLLVTGLALGGAERWLACLAIELQRRGWNPDVLALLPGGPLVDELRAAGVAVATLGMARGRASALALARYVGHLRRRRPAIVHSTMYHANLLARVGRTFAPRHLLVNTIQNSYEGGRVRELALRATDPLVERVVQVSRDGARRYASKKLVGHSKLLVLPNCVDCERFRADANSREAVRREVGVAQGTCVVLMVARFVDQKDHATVIRAVAELDRGGEDFELWLLGAGPLRSSVEAAVAAHGLERRVRFLGERADVERIYCGADILTLASHWEGLPLCVLEGGATGLPLVAAAVPGSDEWFGGAAAPGCFLFPPGDAEALSRSLARLMGNRALREQAGHSLRHLVLEHRSHLSAASSWEDLYRQLLSPPAQGERR